MNNLTGQPKTISRTQEVAALLIAWALWMFMFRHFLSGKLALFDDALSYYDHVKFYLDSLRQGVFPLWDPVWFCGAANHFFLQRMGCFNPFLLLTNIFHSIGVPYTTSYLLYLGSYFFIGCVGFYLLAKRLLNDRLCAFAVFALLLFSSLGSRVFDSYMILMFTPIMWFFYFLVAFGQGFKRYSFVGLILSLIIIFTTYIPFYFLLVFLSFVVFYILMYARTVPGLLRRSVGFAAQNKALVFVCILILLASLVPGYLFFKASSGKGEFIMPSRNTNQAVGSVLGVQSQDRSNNSWSFLEEIFFAQYFYADMTQVKFAIFYIPLLAYLIFFLGFLTRVKKNALFLFVWGVGLLLICMPLASPVYSFLYRHIFFFKYFRNLHFLLWVALWPMFCLFLGTQLKSILAWRSVVGWERWAIFLYLSAVHGAFAWFMHTYQFPIVTNYCALAMSYVFFVWYLFGSLSMNSRMVFVVLLAVIAVEPIEVYRYLSQNSRPYMKYAYSYDYTDLKFHYTRYDNDIDMALSDAPVEERSAVDKPAKRYVQPAASIYYASKWYGQLSGNIDYDILRKYRKHRFILYDAVERLSEPKIDFQSFETSLAENRNVAFVSTGDPGVLNAGSQGRHSYYAQPLEGDSENFRVKGFHANRVTLATDFAEPKFLVYNDSFHTQWRASINGRPVTLVRTNIAFKGLWVPAGKQTVEFIYGGWSLWLIYLFLFVAINGMFVGLLWLWRQDAVRTRELEAEI